MPAGKSSTGTQSHRGPATDLWRHTLARIPTLFGRLVYLSSLRNQNTDVYEHPGLTQMFGEEQAGETLRRSHYQVFQDWLCLNLEQQKADLQEYLAELPGSPAAALTEWLKAEPYRKLAPPSAQDVEQRLYITDLEILVELLKRESSASSNDRGS